MRRLPRIKIRSCQLKAAASSNGNRASAISNRQSALTCAVMAVVQQVENAQGQAFAAGRHDQDQRFHVPQAQQAGDIPGGGQSGRKFAANGHGASVCQDGRPLQARHRRQAWVRRRAMARATAFQPSAA